MSTPQGSPSNDSSASRETALIEKLKFLRSQRPKPWTINHSTRTITSSSASATEIGPTGTESGRPSDESELKEPYVFNPHVCERVTSGEGDEAMLSRFEPGKCRLRLHSDLLKPSADHDDRKAMLLTDTPIGLVFVRITYHGPTADEEPEEACMNVTGYRGVTVRDVLLMAYQFSMLPEIAKGKSAAEIKEILVDAREAIWVTAAEKLKVEKEGQVTIPKSEVESNRWLVLTANEQSKSEAEDQMMVPESKVDSEQWLVLTEEPKRSTPQHDG